MNKIIIGIIIVIVVVAAGFLIFKKTSQAPVPSQTPQTTSEQTAAPSAGASFDINDNLDQALKELDQVDNFSQ